jgi:hypothetical protein
VEEDSDEVSSWISNRGIEMKRSSQVAVVLAGSFSLLVAGWTYPYVRPSSGTTPLHYVVKTFEFKPDGDSSGLNDKGMVVGTTETDPAGGSQAVIYDGKVHVLNGPPGGWVHVQADDVNNHGAMAVSADVFLRSSPVPRRSHVANTYGAYVAVWSAGAVRWRRLGGTTTTRPGAGAYDIAPDGDVAGEIFGLDQNTPIRFRSMLWIRRPNRSYAPMHPPMDVGDVTSYRRQDFLVGARSGEPAFLVPGRTPITLTLTGTTESYGFADSVALASPGVFYVSGTGSKTRSPHFDQPSLGLLWTVDCTSTLSCSQAGDPTLIKPPRKCFSIDRLEVNSHRLLAGECLEKSYSFLPFVWSNGFCRKLEQGGACRLASPRHLRGSQ